MLSFLLNCKRIYNDFIKDEVTVYAAQASFFIVLSAAPFIMILLTLIQLIPAVGSDARDDTASSLQHPPAD